MKRIFSMALISTIAMSAALTTQVVNAEEYRFTYSKFYTQIKNNQKEGHQDVKVGIFFVDSETRLPCQIEKAWMEKEEHYEEFAIGPTNELPVPLDANLKSANPLIFVTTESGKQCDYALTVLANDSSIQSIDEQTIQSLTEQMTLMLADLGGMFSKWFSPDVTGLTLEFSEPDFDTLSLSNGKQISIVNNRAIVTLDDIEADVTLLLPTVPQRIMPWIAQ